MPPPSYTLYTPEASFRAFSTLIVAEYNGIDVLVVTDDVLTTASTKSPVGKLPVLETPPVGSDGKTYGIFSSHAAARYLAHQRPDTGLTGQTAADAAAVDAWMDWAAAELELPACVWFYPVAGYMPFNQASYEKAKKDFAAALLTLDKHLKDKTYLVGNQITLADIVVASTLLYPFKLVADRVYLQPFGNVTRWFQACVHQAEFAQVVGKVTLCQQELLAPGQQEQ